MPIPDPNSGETRKGFVGRCIGVLRGHGDTADSSVLAAMCHGRYDDFIKSRRGKKRVTHSPKKD